MGSEGTTSGGRPPAHAPIDTHTDGRRARRERGRIAVIDAMFDLLQEGKVPPPVDLVAERSGVSVSTIFRYFQNLDTLQVQTFERFLERFSPLVAGADDPDAPLVERIEGFVRARLDLYERAGTIMTVGRLRALEHEPLVEASSQMRGLLAAQVRHWFAHELDTGAPSARSDLTASIDAFTSLESWDVMRRTHSRSRPQIDRMWRRGLAALCHTYANGATS